MIISNYSQKLNEETLRALEQVWEFGLPKDYRSFLLKYNGGRPEKEYFKFKDSNDGSAIHSFLGVVPERDINLLTHLVEFSHRIPKNMFPIAYDVFGNFILLSVKGPDRGKVYFWDHEMEADTDQGEVPDYSNLTLIADSFDDFIKGLHDKDSIDVE